MFEEITPESLKAEMLEGLSKTVDTREGSFADEVVGPMALQLYKYYQTLERLLALAFVDENSGGYIDKACAPYGITRKPGARAQTVLEFVGEPGTVISQGTICLSEEGLEYQTTLRKEIPLTAQREAGMVQAPAQAVEVGARYNREANTIIRQLASIPGVTAVRNAQPAEGGADEESDLQLLERLRYRKQVVTASGNPNHYRQWALETDGVGFAKVIPIWDGPGTVKIIIVGPKGEHVDETVVERCAAKIEKERPIGAKVTVESAQELVVTIAVSVKADGKVSQEELLESYKNAVNEYLQEVGLELSTVAISKLSYLLMGQTGVKDYQNLTINGLAENLEVADNQVPVLGEVAVSWI